MLLKRILLICLALYALGILVGYLIVDVKQDEESAASPSARSPKSSEMEEPVAEKRSTRQTKQRILPPTIVLDEEGNFRIPASMGDRLRFSLLKDSEVNAENLAILGLNEVQIDQIGSIVKQTLKEWAERERSVAKELTNTDDEIIISVPGSRAAAEDFQRNLIDGINSIAPDRSTFLEKRLASEIGYQTMQFGAVDYYLRVSRSPNTRGSITFESIKLYGKPDRNRSSLNPGDSLMDYQNEYSFDSSRNFGGTTPPENVEHLLDLEQYGHLIEPKR